MFDDVRIEWRGEFTGPEVDRVHAGAFNTGRLADAGESWVEGTRRFSLGWCTARVAGELVGFANVVTDGAAHAWLQDVIVEPGCQRSGVGRAMVELASQQAAAAGCEWLHADFDDDVADFYLRVCSFTPTSAGLRYLR